MVRRRDLAATLFRVGLTAYGGPAIVAQIRQAIVFEKQWLSDDEFQESVAFAQMLPGPVAIQTAAHVGWRLHGAHGAFLALAAYSLPAFALILALSAAYFHFESLPAVAAVFKALATVIVAIVVESILAMAQPALKDLHGVAIAALAAWGFFAGANALLVLLAAALVGVALRLGRGDSASEAAPVAPHARPRAATAVAVLVAGALLASALFGSGRVNRELPSLGATMAKINLLSFGGGYTAVALMYQETVRHPERHWLSAKEFVDGLALSQVTPGPVIVTGTFIGYRVGRLPGALLATACLLLPSSFLLVLLAPHFAAIRRLEVVRSAVRGLLAAFIAMLLHVLAEVAKAAFVAPWAPIASLAAVLGLRARLPVVWLLLAAIAAGLLFLR
jgi:chromate transporter